MTTSVSIVNKPFQFVFLTLFLIGVSWVQPSKVKDVVVAWRRRLKRVGFMGLEVGSFSYFVVYLEREDSMDF